MQSLMWWTGCNFTVSLDGDISGPYSLLTLDPLKIQPAIVFSVQGLDAFRSHVLVVRKIPDDPGYVSRLPDEPTSQLNVDAFLYETLISFLFYQSNIYALASPPALLSHHQMRQTPTHRVRSPRLQVQSQEVF